MTGGRAVGSVEDVFRDGHGRLLGMLVRSFGDLDLAEDVASDSIPRTVAVAQRGASASPERTKVPPGPILH